MGGNGMQSLWPSSGFTPPSSALSISSCSDLFTNGNLNPDRAYKADSTCIQTSLTALGVGGKYKMTKDGVVVIYATGNTSIKFSNNFRSESSAKRIVLVSNPKIIIGSSVGQMTPNAGNPDIEAILISNTEINFESAAVPASGTYDTSVVIEGSVISPSIKMLRNRGDKSDYPAELIVYNPYYFIKLRLQEEAVGYTNYTGLLVPESLWGNTQ